MPFAVFILDYWFAVGALLALFRPPTIRQSTIFTRSIYSESKKSRASDHREGKCDKPLSCLRCDPRVLLSALLRELKHFAWSKCHRDVLNGF